MSDPAENRGVRGNTIKPHSVESESVNTVGLSTKDYPVVDITWFGAKPQDDNHNDTQAFDDAASHLSSLGGGVLRLPQGTITVDTGRELPDGVVLAGQGPGATTIDFGTSIESQLTVVDESGGSDPRALLSWENADQDQVQVNDVGIVGVSFEWEFVDTDTWGVIGKNIVGGIFRDLSFDVTQGSGYAMRLFSDTASNSPHNDIFSFDVEVDNLSFDCTADATSGRFDYPFGVDAHGDSSVRNIDITTNTVDSGAFRVHTHFSANRKTVIDGVRSEGPGQAMHIEGHGGSPEVVYNDQTLRNLNMDGEIFASTASGNISDDSTVRLVDSAARNTDDRGIRGQFTVVRECVVEDVDNSSGGFYATEGARRWIGGKIRPESAASNAMVSNRVPALIRDTLIEGTYAKAILTQVPTKIDGVDIDGTPNSASAVQLANTGDRLVNSNLSDMDTTNLDQVLLTYGTRVVVRGNEYPTGARETVYVNGTETILDGTFPDGINDQGTRTIINGVSKNAGDPSVEGEWNGQASTAADLGVTVKNTSVTPNTFYKSTGSEWIQIG